MDTISDTSQQIELLSAQQLFKGALLANMTAAAGSTIVAVFYYLEAGVPLASWLALIYLTACARILTSKKYFLDLNNNFNKYPVKHWINTYTLLSFASGMTWAALIFFIPTTTDTLNITALYIIFIAAMAGAIITLPVVLATYYAFTAPIFLACFSLAFFIDSRLTLFISISSVLFYLFIAASGRILNQRHKQIFQLDIENEQLIDKLHAEIIKKELAEKKLIMNQEVLKETVEMRTEELNNINKVLVNEINERRRIESNFEHMAHHDALTNLPNRLLLDARLKHAIKRANRRNLHVAVIFIDLDNFKTVNDSLGHDIGDELLVAVSHRLTNCVRDEDTVARLGGDEFIIIIEQVNDIGDLDLLLKKIMRVSTETISINDHELNTSVSIGVSIYPDDGKTSEQLMRNADAAMYHVKKNGRNKYHFYTRELSSTAFDRTALETDLKHAIEAGQILVHYQPQVSLKTKTITGVEALVRWKHPDLGILPPKQFLFIAEQTDLINIIGETVLTTACKQIVEWKQQDLPIETVAVNISANQIHNSDLVVTIKNTLQQTNCRAEWLELDIAENLIIRKSDKLISAIQQLHDLGVSIAIDNFGTGSSSLSDLKQLPVNKLKIDQSFITNLNQDEDDATLVQTIIAMGKSLQLKLIAQGLEFRSHEAFLTKHGCEYAQGFYYSNPVAADKIKKMCIGADEHEKSHNTIKLVNK